MNETENLIKYYSAVDADKYRVTCMKINANNEKKAFILDKQYGVNGFNKEQIIDRVSEMVKIQSRGDNIYLTPLSEKKHHILIDDMNPTKLQKFLKDGYNPAVILRSSPNNFQAILTIPKLGSIHDRDVGNRITERLNKLYGDEKLSGCIHPHRVPGFLNQKAKHQCPDGSFPEVLLLHNEKTTCEKALLFSKEINIEYQDNAKIKAKRQTENIEKAKSYIDAGNTNNAYFLHLDNIKQNLDITDKSRVDSMIALRLRATGHSETSIESAIRDCAPAWREESERKNWGDYAQRTAAYAFGMAGDRDLMRNEKYLDHWMKLEEREITNTKTQKGSIKKIKL